MPSVDALGRPLRDLRVSVTDRCNLRCVYCMPRDVFGRNFPFAPRRELLSFEEIARLARIFVSHGAEKIRLTGGEPLVRRDLEDLVALLAATEGIRDVTLTTNGVLLTPQKAASLKRAGLNRVTISLDSLDDPTFRAMNDVDISVAQVLRAIEIAVEAGLSPVKVDVVVMRRWNAAHVLDLARYFRGTDVIVRFIEYMDVGNSNGWRMEDVVPGREILERIGSEWALVAIEPSYKGEVAQRWKYADGAGEIGIITSVTQPFCGDCTRARLSAKGELFTCLFASSGRDLRSALRGGASDEEISAMISSIWTARTDRYSEIRSAATSGAPKVEMSQIGG